ncbi:HIG1 domain family member 2A-like [Acanthaster planci]|uniref:HIG1 domain family member 2A-like n=1 Tax=Acanthaster planci TaxID=133434 RepID=A0A8B7XKX5_ACAPL|nr:HIG1 domain family member 2A-like [Acanthaster planci]
MAPSTTEVMKPAEKTVTDPSFHRYPSSSPTANIGQMPVELADWEPVTPLGFKEKFKKKALENPFVPIGIFATTCALTIGLVSFRRGQVHRSQMMMRARVAAQAFTIGAVLVGVALQTRKSTKSKKP